MKTIYLIPVGVLLLILSLIMIETSFGQGGVSSGSVGSARAGAHYQTINGRYQMASADQFRVEEFINYHRHDIPTPLAEEPKVKLSVHRMELDNDKSIFQFGIATPRAIDYEKLPPMNLVLVVDKSSSMSGDRIANVKKSLTKLLERFRKDDRVAIVTFNHEAKLLLKATPKTNVNKIRKSIESIKSNGATNLHAGLMLGYKTALANFDPKRTNRLIFLTDGNANVGETQSAEIARQSKLCNDEGISLMTIGLGVDFNDGLLQEIAQAGYGTTHFIADDKDIKKIFVDEVDSLLAPAARAVELTIDYGKTQRAPKIYGYEPVQKKTKYQFKLNDLNHGATQVVLAKVAAGEQFKPEVTLKYIDAITNEKVALTGKLSDQKQIKSLRRNYAIALVAESLHEAAEQSNKCQCVKAEQLLKKGIEKAKKLAPKKDQEVERVVSIAAKYRHNILQSIRQNQD